MGMKSCGGEGQAARASVWAHAFSSDTVVFASFTPRNNTEDAANSAATVNRRDLIDVRISARVWIERKPYVPPEERTVRLLSLLLVRVPGVVLDLDAATAVCLSGSSLHRDLENAILERRLRALADDLLG